MGAFVGSEGGKDVVGGRNGAVAISGINAEAKVEKLVSVELVFDGEEAVMAVRGVSESSFVITEEEIEVVVGDEKALFGAEFVEMEDFGDAVAREIHESLGGDEEPIFAVDLR